MKNDSQLARDFLANGRSSSCPVIEMHGHYGPFQGIYFPSSTADAMVKTMDRAGVCMIVCRGTYDPMLPWSIRQGEIL